jgi:L-2-hydroxyglutarate oxidase LhgO
MPDLSPEAKARAARTIDVAAVFSANAETIVAQLSEVPEEHVLVAVVDAEHAYTGTEHVQRAELSQRVPQLEADGWAMVFSPGTSVADVQRRTAEMADIARARIAAIDRILARRAE